MQQAAIITKINRFKLNVNGRAVGGRLLGPDAEERMSHYAIISHLRLGLATPVAKSLATSDYN